MANQDGLRFLFDITDKITAKLAKIEAKAVTSAAKIDKAFTRASKSQETNSLKVAALEQRRVAAAQSNSAKLAAIEQRRVAAVQSSTAKLAAIEQKRVAAVQSNSTKLATIEQKREVAAQRTSERAAALLKRESDARTRFAAKTHASAQKANEKTVALLKRESDARARSTAKAIANEKKRIVAVEKTHAKAVTLLKRETDAFKRSMTRLASASAVAFAAVAGKAIQMAGGYDQAMRSVQAKTGATGALMDRLSEQSREMGRTTVHSATEAARGQAFLAQAGFDTNEILEALPATLALATAGELDLASAADIASNVLSGFRLETIETGRVTDVLAAIAARTNTSVSQMGEALSKAAPAAAAAGWSLEQTAAAIGRLSDAGIQGEEAGTVLKTMLARLAAPTGKLAELMTATGISVTDATGKMLPLNDIIAQLAPHADNTGLMFELLGTRGANAGLILGSLGDDDLTKLTAELENSEGAAQTMADTMSGGLWGAIKSIQSIVESAYISLGERFEPAVKALAKVFGKLPGPIQEVVVVVGSLAGAMGGLMVLMPQAFGALTNLPGKLIKVAGGLRKTAVAQRALNVAMRLNPIGLVITAVAALAAGIYILWNRNKKLAEGFDASAVSTDELTDRLDVLNATIDQQKTSIDKARESNRRALAVGEQRLRGLVEERDELQRHVQQREKAARLVERAARRTEELAQIARDRVLAEKVASEAATAAAAEAVAAAEKLIAIEATKRRAIVEHIQARREAEREAAAELIALEASKRLAVVAHLQARREAELAAATEAIAIEAAKRRAVVLHIQARREAEREATEQIVDSEEAATSFGSVMQSVAGSVGGAFKHVYDAVSNVFSALAKGDVLGAVFAGVGAVWGAFAGAVDGWFNGAAMRINDMRDALGDMFSSIDSGAMSAEVAWERMLWVMDNAETGGAQFDAQLRLQQLIEDTGRTAVEAERLRLDWQRRWDAASTDAELRLLTAERARWAEEAIAEQARIAAAEETARAAAAAAEEAAREVAAFWDNAYNTVISAYRKSQSEGVAAYDRVFEAAIESGLGQEEATLAAAQAQQDAVAEVLAAEGEKYVQLARFEAALEAIRSGNAEGAVAAANQAAEETRAAWDIALGAVAEADRIASGAIEETSTATADAKIDDVDRVLTAEEEASMDALALANGEQERKRWLAEETADAQIAEALRAANGINAEMDKIINRKVKIEYHGSQTGDHGGDDDGSFDDDNEGGYEGRQHGGPVRAGRPYMVGERGPELFVPSRSGRIEPNGSSGGAVDAKALAKAVADALEGTRVDVDGRQLGRLVVRHQPLAVAELGGRR